MKLTRYFLILLCSLSLLTAAAQQDRLDKIEAYLKMLNKDVPGLNEKVELSVNGVSIQEFIRGLATAHNLNVSIDPGLNVTIVNNFSNATVSDVLLFLCRQYDLDITFIGNIMSFTKYVAPLKEPEKPEPKKLKILYNDKTDFLSLDLKKDSLYAVAMEITRQSLKNVVLAPDLENKIVSCFIQNRPFKDALEKMAFANDLAITATEDNFYLIEKKKEEAASAGKAAAAGKAGQPGPKNQGLKIKIDEKERITVQANDVAMAEVIESVSAELVKNYFLFSEPKGNTTLYIENATYSDFLTYLLNGSDFTFKKDSNIYLIGERKLERLRSTEVLSLQNRTVEKISEAIPAELKKDVDIKEFPELNSLILSGSHPRIEEIKRFVRDIDKVVPVVLIDVMVVDYKKSRTLATGISAGVGQTPKTPGGSVYPGIDFTLSTDAINDLINSFNGFGFLNLGKVTPNFYLSIQALEEDGILKTRSTPKLATINGHEASLSIGQTEYYLEIANNVIGSQNPQNIISQQYKSVKADLSVTINPIVSGDGQVTLDIKVKQSSFTPRISPNAPPGTVTRDFQSLIRVRDQEMILLGGLEEKVTDETGSGFPFLSRVPVLKWIFGKRTRKHQKSKLNIFIKPTILY